MIILVENLSFRAILGILPHERKIPQKIVIDLSIEYEYKNGDFINYADVVKLVQNLMRVEKFELIEDAILSLENRLFERYKNINELKISISKPNIIKNTNVKIEKRRKF